MYKIDGFLFEDETTAELAKKEEAAVSYLKQNTALDEVEGVYQLYTKLLEQNLFVTPVGIRFLTELQSVLYQSEVPKETIPSIPIAGLQVPKAEQEPQTEVDVNLTQEAIQAETSDAQIKVEAVQNASAQKEKTAKKKSEKKQDIGNRETAKYKKAFHVSLFFAIVFGFSVVGMFFILELSGNNVTIINYRNKIIDEYSTWEAQLKEKEAMLKDWEEQLNQQ